MGRIAQVWGRATSQIKKLPCTLASQLTQQLGRFVFERTGLQGEYDLNLEWTPDLSQTNNGFPGPPPGGGPEVPPRLGDNGPSLFTALQDELGLRLEATRGPVQVLVVDHAEMPSAN